MELAKAVTKFIRIPPRKARLVANLIRGLKVEDAGVQLGHCKMKSGRLLKKTLDSAVANAEVNLDARRDMLHVLEVRVDEGPTMKRAKSRSKGSRSPILKRTSHFTVVVGEKT
ncbi:MAG: 50S ribosomal protein L22 [Chlamydiales bacterium]|nr:50S ribosomal protein L22 [Chlamydiales bacterium]MCH9619775.1 50S ribosomal protein L22 [Chlamydiales bacterium]MCH9623381.1 50S ribosomal protein L22 [Chlamydiales bacterium]